MYENNKHISQYFKCMVYEFVYNYKSMLHKCLLMVIDPQ